jgi:hypothetical protein
MQTERGDRVAITGPGYPMVLVRVGRAGDRPALLRVDAVTGAVLWIDRDPERSRFAGWAAVP